MPGVAAELGVHGSAAVAVVQQQGGALGIGGVAVAPVEQGDQDRVQLLALGGEPVLVTGPLAGLLVALPVEDAVLDQRRQAGGEQVAGDADAPLELLEPPVAVERLAQDQQRPPLAHDLQRARDRTVLGAVPGAVVHPTSVL
ncbi:hypothetical protein GCM10018954_025790 [Kutzneria kofuensis]